MKSLKTQKGLTLSELMIAVMIGLLVLLIISSIFMLNQKVFRKSNTKAELIQNARIALDLMAREIRQANKIVTILPVNNSDPNLLSEEILFEDGHNSSYIQYIKYYLNNTDLKRQTIAYYFETEPEVYVHWNDFDAFGNPEITILEDKLIGENFSDIFFYGEDRINIELILEKSNEIIQIKSIINPRNI